MWPFTRRKPEIVVHTRTETMTTFEALEDFDEIVNNRVQPYRRGQFYQVREGNTELAEKANAWAERGLIKWGRSVAKVSGTGKVG